MKKGVELIKGALRKLKLINHMLCAGQGDGLITFLVVQSSCQPPEAGVIISILQMGQVNLGDSLNQLSLKQ